MIDLDFGGASDDRYTMYKITATSRAGTTGIMLLFLDLVSTTYVNQRFGLAPRAGRRSITGVSIRVSDWKSRMFQRELDGGHRKCRAGWVGRADGCFLS